MLDVKLGCSWSIGRPVAQPLEAGLFRLLEAIARSGSLNQAARAIGLSYRHAWGLLRKWSRQLGEPLVQMERGRGAQLTRLAESLLIAEQRAQAELGPHFERVAAEIAGLLAPQSARKQAQLTIHASHDLALAQLRDALNRAQGLHLELQFHGSLDSLASLARGNCDLAGFHAPELQPIAGATAALRRWLKPRSHSLVRFVAREQGLIVARGNPRAIRDVTDLARSGVHIVNRQPGSGSRLLFEQLLADAGVDARQLAGYEIEEFTHLAVAATVASGMADAGFGIRAAAVQHGLDFIPLAQESYLLACRNSLLERASLQQLLAVLRDAQFRAIAGRLPGYDAARAGEVCTLPQALPWLAAPVRSTTRHGSMA
ncbi:MAG TPA: substrate-binding domain-containing protein [Burkholderiales bacterium]|nr:substrate-binding domain-containing protein [Burkholderiales bacterium]